MNARARAVAAGLVQGVAFRAHAVDEAQRLGVRGWVHNLPDGRVEALVEGERSRVEAFLAWYRQGPRFARVDDVEVTWERYAGDLGEFTVR